MNKEFLKSSAYTFVTGAIISLGIFLETQSTFVLEKGAILSLLAVILRGGIKALSTYYVMNKYPIDKDTISST